jgi:hypothetical protein
VCRHVATHHATAARVDLRDKDAVIDAMDERE